MKETKEEVQLRSKERMMEAISQSLSPISLSEDRLKKFVVEMRKRGFKIKWIGKSNVK